MWTARAAARHSFGHIGCVSRVITLTERDESM